jgi:hypothetical protein
MHAKRLYINVHRDGYAPDQCGNTMTVAELIAYLDQFDGGMQVFTTHDGRYTYGYITENDFSDSFDWEEEDEDERSAA